MQFSRKCYGEININAKDLIESIKSRLMKLEYYGLQHIVSNEFTEYGIEIIKKEYINNQFSEEKNSINIVAENEEKLEEIIMILKRNAVTPMSLEDVISDLYKG